MPFKLGLRHRDTPADVPMMARVVRAATMSAPATEDWHAKCLPDGDALGNMDYSNCAPIAALRAIQIRRAVAWGDSWKPTRTQALELYAHLTGFDPATGEPDAGTYTDDAMRDWCSHGIRLDSQNQDVPVWVSIQRRVFPQIRAAIAHFGPVQLSFMLPRALMDDPLGSWDLPMIRQHDADWKPGTWGGHRVTSGKYDQDSFTVRTWGMDVQVSIAFMMQYCVAVDATLSRAWLDTTGLSPLGLEWPELVATARNIGTTSRIG